MFPYECFLKTLLFWFNIPTYFSMKERRQFHISKEHSVETMMDSRGGMDDDEAVQKFLEAHPDLKEEWMKD